MSADLRHSGDATALLESFATGASDPLTALEHAMRRLDELNPLLNAVIHQHPERALREAEAAARRWRQRRAAGHAADRDSGSDAAAAHSGQDSPTGRVRHRAQHDSNSSSKRGGGRTAPNAATAVGSGRMLDGVPIAVKDLGCEQAGEPHHAGARFLAERGWRADGDSHLWELLRSVGAVSVGRTNTPEFGTTITTEPAVYGPTRNPWSVGHSAGGSSGGSAAAVAAGIVTAAHGNDGGGSIRIPAAACGLVGLKPSRGRVSVGPRLGEHRGGLAIDGMLTRTVRDAALCLDVISRPAVGDPYHALPLPPGVTFSAVVSAAARLAGGTAHGDRSPRSPVPAALAALHRTRSAATESAADAAATAMAQQLLGIGSGVADVAGHSRSGRLRIAVSCGPEGRERATAPARAAVEDAAVLLDALGHEIVPDTAPSGWWSDEPADHAIVVRTVAMAAELDSWTARLGAPVGPDDVEPANWWSAQLGRSLDAVAYAQALEALARWRRRVMTFWNAPRTWPTDSGGSESSRRLARSAGSAADRSDRRGSGDARRPAAAPPLAAAGFDLLLTPVLGDLTPPLGWLSDPLEGALRVRSLTGFVDQANITGQPAISLPTGVWQGPAPEHPALENPAPEHSAPGNGRHRSAAGDAGRRGGDASVVLPIGVQLIAAAGNEALLLAVAQQVSDAGGFITLPDLAASA